MTNDLAGHVTALLDLYRTGELDPPVRERVAAHLAGCETCARDLSALEAFSGVVSRGLAASRALRGDAAPDAAGARRRGVISRIAEADRRGARWFPAGLPRWAPQALAAAVGAIALGVLLRQGVWPPGREGPEPGPERPTPADGLRDEGVETARAPRNAAPDLAAEVEEQVEQRTVEDRLATPAPGAEDARAKAASDARAPTVAEAETRAGADAEAAEEADFAGPPAEAPDRAAAAEPAPSRERAAVGAQAPAAAPPAPDEDVRPETLAADAALERDDEVAGAESRSPGERLLADFVRRARAALAVRDRAAADEALDLWSDSLAGRSDVAPGRLESAGTLADSLEDLVASAEEDPDRE